MDLRALRWFQQVADGATVTELSELDITTQSGISRALARLEEELGTPLLRRQGRTLRPTMAGVAFKRHVDAAIHELDDGVAAVQQLLDPRSGVVSVAFQPSLGTWLVPDLVSGFRAEHPGVRFDLRRKHEELDSAVGPHSAVELEFSTRRPHEPDLQWRALTTEPLVLAVSTKHPRFSNRTEVHLSECADEPFITIRATSALRGVSAELLERAGIAPETAFVCDDLPTMRAFVAAGLGVAIMPRPREGAGASIREVAIDDALARREVGVSWAGRRRLLPAAQLFRDYVLSRRDQGTLPSAP